tara:strand:- start:2243 stop:2668 length:426 start_codon:yes stop_codon:yes gene_type:complete
MYKIENLDNVAFKKYLSNQFIANNDSISSNKENLPSEKLNYLKSFDSFSIDTLKDIKNKLLRKYLILKSTYIKPDKNNHLSYNNYHFDIDITNYFDYFNALFLNNKKLSTTGDITPSYAGLPIEAFKYIKNNLEKNNLRLK